MIDLDDLLYRRPLSNGPVSLLVRVAGSQATPVLERAARLMARRTAQPSRDEVVLLLDKPPPANWPARLHGVRLRCLVRERADHGSALAAAITYCRHAAVVVTGPDVSLSPDQLSQILRLLDGCDLVVGRRQRYGGWLGWPLEWLARWVFAVSVADPLCMTKAIRRPAVVGAVLQTSGAIVDFELVAKLTFLTSVVDEMRLPNVDDGAPTLAGLILKEAHELWQLFWHPQIWSFDARNPRFRPKLNVRAAPPRNPKRSSLDEPHYTQCREYERFPRSSLSTPTSRLAPTGSSWTPHGR